MKVDRLDADVYRFPTRTPEADGTLGWGATTVVAVTVHAGDLAGLGWTYSTSAAATLVRDVLCSAVSGCPVDNVAGAFEQMRRVCRNFGTRGVVMQAVSAVDIALWDLKALAEAFQLPLSAHCAPAAPAPVAVATPRLRHIEYFADHERLEPMLLHGVPAIHDGRLRPNATIGHGYTLRSDLREWRIGRNR